MQLEKKKVEEGMCKNILDSLELTTKPELVWTNRIVEGNGMEYTRKDGLVITAKYNSITIKNPIKYKFDIIEIENKIYSALTKLKSYLYLKEVERLENEKMQKLVDFFGLDIKKQRKDKIQKIENKQEN